MKGAIILLCLLVLCVNLNLAKDLVVGTRTNNLLVSTEKLVIKSIPFIRRDKDYTYVDSKNRLIKGIIARDLSRTDGEDTYSRAYVVTLAGTHQVYQQLLGCC
ncbi:hypothetical protein K1T71_006728 [Dendrolimus kikuchii]|uniref:Uncharacterized protein n=1 Tax=Dendrolimus kikuchii TaxID=765133 RepID=A0ACC1D1U8_9NEOP|nr:hypothetical protein K1T71_006728 [Dendrolimus kikuchii]